MNTLRRKYDQPNEHVCVECVIVWIIAMPLSAIAMIQFVGWCYRSFIA